MFQSESLLARVFKAIVIGVVVGLFTALVLVILSALLPGVVIDARFWGIVVGLAAGLYYLLTGKRAL